MSCKSMDMLREEISALLKKGGAMQSGVADLKQVRNIIASESLREFDRAISFAVSFPRAVIDELSAGPSHTYLYYYRVVNTLIDELSLKLSAFLETNGFTAYPIPSSQRAGKDRLESIFPHRLAASLAGLGWIGKSGCLINKNAGPRLRLGTVLTNANLPADKPVEILCGDCKACVEACPSGAIIGKSFSPDAPYSERLNPSLCDKYQNQVRDRFGKRVCGLCIAACPYGKKS